MTLFTLSTQKTKAAFLHLLAEISTISKKQWTKDLASNLFGSLFRRISTNWVQKTVMIFLLETSLLDNISPTKTLKSELSLRLKLKVEVSKAADWSTLSAVKELKESKTASSKEAPWFPRIRVSLRLSNSQRACMICTSWRMSKSLLKTVSL